MENSTGALEVSNEHFLWLNIELLVLLNVRSIQMKWRLMIFHYQYTNFCKFWLCFLAYSIFLTQTLFLYNYFWSFFLHKKNSHTKCVVCIRQTIFITQLFGPGDTLQATKFCLTSKNKLIGDLLSLATCFFSINLYI